MPFEAKVLLIFCSAMLVVFFVGPGNLSFSEAKAKADKYESTLSANETDELKKNQDKFAEIAFPACSDATGTEPDNFTVVVEITVDGYVSRSWRKGNSKFAICFQKSVTDHFVYWTVKQSFFISFEYNYVSFNQAVGR